MKFFLKNFIILLFAAAPIFSQTQAEREQGLVTSEPFWRQALGGAVLSLPSVQAQSAVVALDGGNIRAYSTAGTPLWNYSARGRISPYVTRSREGTSYISRLNGVLIAVNRIGRELWRRDIEGPLCARVIVGWDGRLFAPTEKKIFCFTASGTLLWSKTLESSFLIAPKLDRNGGILFALENNEVHQIDPFGNSHVWKLAAKPSALISIREKEIVIIYPDGTMDIPGASDDWYFSAQSDGHASVLPKLPSGPLAAVIRDNNIALTLNDGRIALVSIDQRKILWTGDSHIREIFNSRGSFDTEVEMIFDERGIYILSKNGATGFSHNGRRYWLMYLQNAAAVPAFGNDGVLYSGGVDWILHTYKIEDRRLPERNALYGPLPEGSYKLGLPQASGAYHIPLNENETRLKIDQIRANINTGNVGKNEPDWTSFLLTVSAGQQPMQFRLGAINLLGKIGSYETIPWLINIFRNDSEHIIRSAAITAIGVIGVDPQGVALQAFSNYLVQTIKDEMILTAIASATGALCRFSGPPLSEAGVKILNTISARNFPPLARRQAARELESLR